MSRIHILNANNRKQVVDRIYSMDGECVQVNCLTFGYPVSVYAKITFIISNIKDFILHL